MNSPAENILQNLFQTTSLKNVSAEQLLHEINDHPYNGAAYFLLAKKLYLSNDADYKNALEKAAIHFKNNLWLDFNLNNDDEQIEKENVLQTSQPEKTQTDNSAYIQIEPPVFDEEEKDAVSDSFILDKDDLVQAAENDFVEEQIEADILINEKLSSLLQQHASAFEKPVETDAEVPVENTPYHRVDYFDSQGIKLDEDKANDKLGTQLKRFTDWLKQMKRINPNDDIGNDEAGETTVKNIAEHSNEPEEIVTEAMADVLIKQGKPEQAIQIYQKLSFNNPAKSAYFAAKIEELKG